MSMEKRFLVGDILDLDAMGHRFQWRREHGAFIETIMALAARAVAERHQADGVVHGHIHLPRLRGALSA